RSPARGRAVDGDPGPGEIDGVGAGSEVCGARDTGGAKDAGVEQLTQPTMDRVLRDELKPIGDAAHTGFDDELAVAAGGVDQQIVQHREGFRPVLLQEPERVGVAVLDPDLSSHQLALRRRSRDRPGAGEQPSGYAGSDRTARPVCLPCRRWFATTW